MFTSAVSNINDMPIIDTNPIITFSIFLYELENNMNIIKPLAIKAPILIGILNNILRAMAAPNISAIAVPIAASTAVPVIILPIVGFIYLFIASEIQRPVTIPK
jgi:hypothetical protein